MNVAALILAVIGVFFFVAGTLGLLRFPDFFTRVHAVTKCDTVGAGSILLALALVLGLRWASAKVVILMMLILITSPTAGHALARAAFRTGLKPWKRP